MTTTNDSPEPIAETPPQNEETGRDRTAKTMRNLANAFRHLYKVAKSEDMFTLATKCDEISRAFGRVSVIMTRPQMEESALDIFPKD